MIPGHQRHQGTGDSDDDGEDQRLKTTSSRHCTLAHLDASQFF
jgi:hypothetical protein